jgi:D-sedoheptulose 7-phosphate isomerase
MQNNYSIQPDQNSFLAVAKERLLDSAHVKKKIAESPETLENIKQAAIICIESLKQGGCIFFCGNGGSASDAQHLSAELSGRFYYDRRPLRSEALHANTSFLTAVANDYSFDEIFSRLLEGQGKQNDVLVCLSTSGNSKNIVAAAKKAKHLNIQTIALTGELGGLLSTLTDICIKAPSKDTARIQESHITIGHILCEFIECSLAPKL